MVSNGDSLVKLLESDQIRLLGDFEELEKRVEFGANNPTPLEDHLNTCAADMDGAFVALGSLASTLLMAKPGTLSLHDQLSIGVTSTLASQSMMRTVGHVFTMSGAMERVRGNEGAVEVIRQAHSGIATKRIQLGAAALASGAKWTWQPTEDNESPWDKAHGVYEAMYSVKPPVRFTDEELALMGELATKAASAAVQLPFKPSRFKIVTAVRQIRAAKRLTSELGDFPGDAGKVMKSMDVINLWAEPGYSDNELQAVHRLARKAYRYMVGTKRVSSEITSDPRVQMLGILLESMPRPDIASQRATFDRDVNKFVRLIPVRLNK